MSLSKQALTFSLNSTPLYTGTQLKQTLSMAPSASVLTGFDCISLHAWSKSPLSFHPFLKNGIHDKIYSVVNSVQALLSIVALCYFFCIKKLKSNLVNTDTEGAVESVHINEVSGGAELRESGIEAESWIIVTKHVRIMNLWFKNSGIMNLCTSARESWITRLCE